MPDSLLTYFAYGSNMSAARLRARIPEARRLGVATLAGHVLRFHKCGADGSAKLDVIATGDATDRVLGVLFGLTTAEKAVLDAIEGPGYAGVSVAVGNADGAVIEAFMYRALRVDATLRPFAWYVHHVLTGAREAGLPTDYVARIAAVETIDDPDAERDARERGVHRARHQAPESQP
ncbi:gamma-glutamylcyclotransferase family protein [Denitromonas iodatirespirans]|uniref:Gamma-glutamylcyclotransferase n=1 Tax=Denitromonas iodatirespirans TaxID=2795389 RepID=A0A944H9B6_DENI1|nr:gamma-glutamylcyclotransferase family protein [Denitromonas iodatirespirans]MBT0962275.1 gamma-glutamylcyclotransferase [Denitromonas iodatirespirans]